ncbi:Predicted nucleic acid-binding protein, contains PIN domain [Marinobacter daqiaonensis]|uniref:Predicted nucleic acid-binding protein, contains PIN domain n=1 Tax=Marinobacter daqiaonensis TaxID=650891 RepID=A0A1I6I5B6_9GAMM|nr:PIN domain-containing protein [Marinobacter daqiaonensis]SFR61824.1 Predicted nucleic acid-binding protein, contains PIN domain [Marinobacter daqiaonensis]
MPKDVILDTNVFVASGFNPHSASAKVVRQVREGKLQMIWDRHTRGEIEHILGKIPGLSRRDSRALFQKSGRFRGRTHPSRFRYVPDPADRKFAALADASGATLISNDDDLLRGRKRARAPIMTPREFQRKRSKG